MRRALLVLLGLITAVAILVVAAALIIGPLLTLEERPDVHAPAVLRIDLTGPVVERAPPDLFAAELEGADLELLDLALALERAATDDRIAGAVLRIESPGYGWAKAEEIRARLSAFRESGKFVHVYVPFTNELGYYVALAADRIVLLPDGLIELNGFRVEAPFIRELLAKLGLEAQVEAAGVYKSAADMLRRDEMSPAEREVVESLLAERHARFVDAVVEARGVDRARLVAALERGTYLGRDLAALGLVDGQDFERDVLRAAVARARGEEPATVGDDEVAHHLVDVADYARGLPDAPGRTAGTIGLVYAIGAITGGESGFDPVFGRTMGAETTIRMLDDVAADEDLDAVVLRVESPGGDALASAEIWSAVEALGKRLPVIVSLGDVAGSGGYYIAVAGRRIVAAPSTLTGSIGVIGVLFNAGEAWDKLGISWDTVRTTPAADFPTATRALTEAERATFRLLIEDMYRTFLQRVAAGRGRTVPEIERVAQGRVWSGTQAAERGLVDEIGGLDAAVAAAREAAGIAPDAAVRYHVYPGRPSVVERLRQVLRLQGLGVGGAPRPGEAAAALVARELAGLLTGAATALREEPRRPLAVMPWVPVVR